MIDAWIWGLAAAARVSRNAQSFLALNEQASSQRPRTGIRVQIGQRFDRSFANAHTHGGTFGGLVAAQQLAEPLDNRQFNRLPAQGAGNGPSPADRQLEPLRSARIYMSLLLLFCVNSVCAAC